MDEHKLCECGSVVINPEDTLCPVCRFLESKRIEEERQGRFKQADNLIARILYNYPQLDEHEREDSRQAAREFFIKYGMDRDNIENFDKYWRPVLHNVIKENLKIEGRMGLGIDWTFDQIIRYIQRNNLNDPKEVHKLFTNPVVRMELRKAVSNTKLSDRRLDHHVYDALIFLETSFTPLLQGEDVDSEPILTTGQYKHSRQEGFDKTTERYWVAQARESSYSRPHELRFGRPEVFKKLSEQQFIVMDLLIQGNSINDVAKRLSMSWDEVNNIRKAAFKRMRVPHEMLYVWINMERHGNYSVAVEQALVKDLGYPREEVRRSARRWAAILFPTNLPIGSIKLDPHNPLRPRPDLSTDTGLYKVWRQMLYQLSDNAFKRWFYINWPNRWPVTRWHKWDPELQTKLIERIWDVVLYHYIGYPGEMSEVVEQYWNDIKTENEALNAFMDRFGQIPK